MNKPNLSEIKELMIRSLDEESDSRMISGKFAEILQYDFRDGFKEKVLSRIFAVIPVSDRRYEFEKYLNFAFYRIAITGVAAIIFLLISIFLNEGYLSFDTLLGMSDGYSESIVCLLTGN